MRLTTIRYWLAMATYRAWHPLVDSVLNHCLRTGIINSRQWHEIAARLDRTQIHCVLYRAAKGELP